MKKLIINSVIIGIVIISLIIAINTINWGKLGIGILTRMTGYEITYEKIEGSLFRGYDIQNYVIKLSPADSISGRDARISYRFSPLSFKLPTIFQLTLVEPVVHLKQKETQPGAERLNIPRMNLSLRLNIKNGRIVYEDRRKYEIENISGLVYIDFLGTNLYITTMNLSLRNSEPPIQIYGANILLNVNPEMMNIKSFQIKGKGLSLQGHGSYIFKEKNLLLQLKSGNIDLSTMSVFKGEIAINGVINIVGNRVIPQVQGHAKKFDFIENVNFETNVLGDTIIINLFDGNALNGNFSSQIKFLNPGDYTVETNFRDIDISRIFKFSRPLLLNGKLAYKEKRFSGVISSPPENGLAIETLLVVGQYKNKQLLIDTISVSEDDFNISIKGRLYPDFELNAVVNKIALERLENFYPLKGLISGIIHCSGRFQELDQTSIGADLRITGLNVNDFRIKSCGINAENFVWNRKIDKLVIDVDTFSYKNFHIDRVYLHLKNDKFSLRILRSVDSLSAKGKLFDDATGFVDSLTITFHNKNAFNLAPISFDILKRKLGNVYLKLAEGELFFTLSENKISISNINLEELFKFLGLTESIRGFLTLSMEKNLFQITAENIFYRGLNNGRLRIEGEYLKDKIQITQLEIHDNNDQSLNGYGMLDKEKSTIYLKFKNIKPWIFPFLNSFMDNPDGLMSGEINFTGNLKDFNITGDAEINNARFGINTIAARFDSGFASVQFSGNQIIFTTIKSQVLSDYTFHTNTRSWVNGGGVIKLESNFRVRNLRFDFSFRDAPLQFQSYAYGQGSGNFTVSMNDGVMSYNGNINIKEGIIPLEFGTYIESASEEEKQEWRMSLRLNGDRNIWLRNRDADVEFGGEVYITKELQKPIYVTGNLETKRGNYYWLNHILKITSGKISFVPQEVIDPELDFWAELNTRERDPETNQEIKIILHCTGNISEPIFEFFSDPPRYSEQDILTYLNLNITWREIESMKQGEYVGRVLPRTVLAYLESDVSRRLRAYTGLDYFRVEAPLFEPHEKTKVTVGKYISRNLFVTYTYDITSYSNEFNVEYFIDDRNEILIRRDETGEYSLQYQYRIRF